MVVEAVAGQIRKPRDADRHTPYSRVWRCRPCPRYLFHHGSTGKKLFQSNPHGLPQDQPPAICTVPVLPQK